MKGYNFCFLEIGHVTNVPTTHAWTLTYRIILILLEILFWGLESGVDPDILYTVSIFSWIFSNFLAIFHPKQRSFPNWMLPWTLNTVPEHCHQQEKCSRYMVLYPSLTLFTFHYLAFVSHDSFLYLSAVVTCDNSSSSIFQTTTTYTLHQE